MTTRIIKKYPNRRLYDTTLGSYVALDDIKQLVIDHQNFQVLDTRTNKDLTQITLFQIIAGEESITPIFTIDLLQDFIRLYHQDSQGLLTKYLEQTMNVFAQQQIYIQKQLQSYQEDIRLGKKPILGPADKPE